MKCAETDMSATHQHRDICKAQGVPESLPPPIPLKPLGISFHSLRTDKVLLKMKSQKKISLFVFLTVSAFHYH